MRRWNEEEEDPNDPAKRKWEEMWNDPSEVGFTFKQFITEVMNQNKLQEEIKIIEYRAQKLMDARASVLMAKDFYLEDIYSEQLNDCRRDSIATNPKLFGCTIDELKEKLRKYLTTPVNDSYSEVIDSISYGLDEVCIRYGVKVNNRHIYVDYYCKQSKICPTVDKDTLVRWGLT